MMMTNHQLLLHSPPDSPPTSPDSPNSPNSPLKAAPPSPVSPAKSPGFQPVSPACDPAAGSPPPASPAGHIQDLHLAWDAALAEKLLTGRQQAADLYSALEEADRTGATNIVVETDEASGEGALTLPVAIAKLQAAKLEKKVSLKGVEYTRWRDPDKRDAMVKKVKASRERNNAMRAAEQRAEKLAIKRALDEKDAFENAISFMTRRVGDIADESEACMLEQEALGVVKSFMAARDYPDYEREAFQIWPDPDPAPAAEPDESAEPEPDEPEPVDDAAPDPDAASDAAMAQIATTDAVKEAAVSHIATLGLAAAV